MKQKNGYWLDKNNNKWNSTIYTKEQAEKYSVTLLNCSNCSNCRDCEYCRDCSDCSNCEYCRDCSDCRYCSDLYNCKFMICNVQFTEEEYNQKMSELEAQQ